MKRQPPAPKYVTRCAWCGALVANVVTSWTTHNKTRLHDDVCPARSSQSPTTDRSA